MNLVVATLAGFLAGAATLPVAAAGNGLVMRPDALDTPSWQARVEFDQPLLVGTSLGTNWALGQTPVTGRLLGDYRIDALRFGQTGGLRLTSGVIVSLRTVSGTGLVFNTDSTASAQPYAGIGYSGGSARGDWGFSAELGVAAQNPGAASQLGRTSNRVSFGETVRDLRLQPMVRLGMNYAF